MKNFKEKYLNLSFLKKETFSWIWVIFLVLAFRTSFYEPFRVPTGSMIPTIMIGDFILVNKMSYGFKLPFTEYMDKPIYLTTPKDPERSDIIVFKYPENPSISYVKRVIGVPGDSIEIINDKLFINKVEIVSYKLKEEAEFKILKEIEEEFNQYPLSIEYVPSSKHKIMFNKDAIRKNYKFVVPKDSFFVLGDDRDFSADSRYWGFVPRENIKGKAFYVWMSWRIPFLGDTGEDSSLFKWWRIGTKI